MNRRRSTARRIPIAAPAATGLAFLVLVLAAPLAAPAQEEAAPPAAADETEPAPAKKPAKPLAIPAAERDRRNPVPPVPEAIESGRILFQSQCSMCHGRNGNGRGDVAASLKLAVPDLTDAKRQARRTDGDWFYIIGRGHEGMPAEKRLVDQQKWEMILYIRTLSAARGKP
jgi:mono/diheme cytochrome c family protein